jgi:hypothetical protein
MGKQVNAETPNGGALTFQVADAKTIEGLAFKERKRRSNPDFLKIVEATKEGPVLVTLNGRKPASLQASLTNTAKKLTPQVSLSMRLTQDDSQLLVERVKKAATSKATKTAKAAKTTKTGLRRKTNLPETPPEGGEG